MLFLKTCLTHRFSKFVLVVCNNSYTVDPPLMAASPQRPFFLANSPYTDSCFNLSATVTSLQWPLSSVPKVAIVEQTTSSLSFFYSPSSKMRDTQMAARVTDGARWERQEKRFFFPSRAAALVSRVSRLRFSHARALLSLNLKKKRDCSQCILEGSTVMRTRHICLT